jgi:hypothetical protein
MTKPRAEFYVKDADGLNKRERAFCLYMLACQGKKPKWAAGQAGYSGDLGKRARSLLEQPIIQEFLGKYAPPVNKFKVTSEPKSIIRRLEQMASAEGLDKTATIQIKAIELMMRNQGMMEGKSEAGRDRLKEILAVYQAGPVELGSTVCKCSKLNGPSNKFCSECGALIEREKSAAQVLAAAKKKAGVKEVIQ